MKIASSAKRLHRIGLLVFVFASIGPAWGDFPKPTTSETNSPYSAVQITRLEFARPRPLQAITVRIDLNNPDIEFVVTPRTPVQEGFETNSATTQEFSEKEKVQLAINASPFAPLRAKSGEPMNISGLHFSRGELISPSNNRPGFGALLINGDNKSRIVRDPVSMEFIKQARHGVGGFHVVLENGKNLMADKAPNATQHPRTAVGLSDNGRYMWWLIVDGRQPTKSEGLTYQELGQWAQSLGLTDLLNLDGGGSTTLVMRNQESNKLEIVNSPVGKTVPGTLRHNGNNLGLRIYSEPNDITVHQLQAIMPRLKTERATLFLGPLNRVMEKYQINTPIRRAAFLAQLAHESGELRYMEEIASGEAYEGRKSLGNTQPGDGKRFKGRGPIQLTGRANYRKAGAALGLDLENNPERVADPEVGCQVAGWFWETRGLNKLADEGDFRQITRRINGGFNGLEKREAYFQKAKTVLGVK